MTIDNDKKRLLVKICRMYYIDGRTQNEISKKIHVSRPQVSRFLAEARGLGIVEISIQDPFVNEKKYAEELLQHYPLKDVILVESNTGLDKKVELGNAVSRLLERLIADNEKIGINAGKSLSYVGNNMINPRKKNITIVPLIGGMGTSDEVWQANATVKRLASKLAAEYSILNAPAFVTSNEAKHSLVSEPTISKVLEQAKKTTLAIVGIGQLSASSTLKEVGFLTEETIEFLKKNGVIANVCNTFIDREGNSVDIAEYDNIIGVKIEEIRAAAATIGVAAGSDKVEAIKASLLGNWIDYLVTDYETAAEILNIKGENQ